MSGGVIGGEQVNRCSVRDDVEIVAGDLSAWYGLAEYHYRDHRLPAVSKVFVMRRGGRERQNARCKMQNDRLIGVIVYGMPLPQIALRNRATGNRYVGLGDRRSALAALNREMRCISRVVIRPEYRGIGLGSLLVRETLGQAGTPLVEAMAVMGRVNPFFEKAGMTRYESRQSERAVRLIAAFGQVGIDQGKLYDPVELIEVIGKLDGADRRFVEREVTVFCSQLRHADKLSGLAERVAVVAGQVGSNPIYYLWRRST